MAVIKDNDCQYIYAALMLYLILIAHKYTQLWISLTTKRK